MFFDAQLNAETLKIPKDIYLRILAKAVAQTQIDIQEMETAFPSADFEKIQAISHRWKGDYDNMRIAPLAQVAKTINQEVKMTRDTQKLLDFFNEFKNQFSQLQVELTSR